MVVVPHPKVVRREPTRAQIECLSTIINGGKLWSWSRAVVLEFLARRDGDRCGICGGPTDRRIREGGNVVVVDTPVQRVGRRRVEVSFDSASLAHRGCKAAKEQEWEMEAAWQHDTTD